MWHIHGGVLVDAGFIIKMPGVLCVMHDAISEMYDACCGVNSV